MRLSLGTKILGSFGIIIFLALGFSVGAGNKFARNEYNEFTVRRDLAKARAMAPYINEWIRMTVNATEQGLSPEDIQTGLLPFMNLFGDEDSFEEDSFWDEDFFEDERRHHMHGRKHHAQKRDPPVFDRLLITDPRGRVLLNTMDIGPGEIPQSTGIAMKEGAEVIGYLYVGSMLPSMGESEDSFFLYDANIRTWLFAMAVFLFAIFLGILLTRHIVGPVKTINLATHQVKKGMLDVRVPDRRRDEMGDLARGFNAMTTALESADIQRRQFIADSAHELRTPVSLIRTRIEMMEEGIYPMDSEGLAALATETDRLVGLIEELKILSSLESPDFIMETAEVDISELVSKAVESRKPSGTRVGIDIETRLSADHIILQANAHQLYRLVDNLLSNALRHAKKHVRIELEQNADSNIEIRVEDDGPGIPTAQRERVFERFYRLEASRNRNSGGTGLGLAICREIARAHGGKINAEASSELSGASIHVVLRPFNSHLPESHKNGPERRDSPRAG